MIRMVKKETIMNNSGSISLSRIGQIAIPVSELNRALEFYRDKLGMKFLFDVPGMAFFDCEGVRILLSLPEKEGEVRQSSILYFSVPDIQLAYRELTGRGVKFSGEPHLIARMPDHELWMAFFEDSEGNTLALMSEVR
jgi:methylmalonyl-CoA/ethylmalonyl-CoA epimerase